MEAKLIRPSSSPGLQSPNVPKTTRSYCLLPNKTRQKSSTLKSLCCSHLSRRGLVSVNASAASVGSQKKKRVDDSETLTLDNIRHSLIRQEDSIIFSLVERSQYCYNADTYDPDAFPMDGFHGTLVEYMLKETEKLHAKVGRYKSPNEHAFFPNDLPEPLLPPLQYPQVMEQGLWVKCLYTSCETPDVGNWYRCVFLYIQLEFPTKIECGTLRFPLNMGMNATVLHPSANSININKKVWDLYFRDIIPRLVKEGNDGNCGSAAVCDTICLKVLSKRIHYGKFVAEAKFRAAPESYEPAIREQDGKKLMQMLTYPAVEEAIKKRVEVKARIFGQDLTTDIDEDGSDPVYKIQPSLVADLYGNWIMPLTKEVQVQYLLRRLD